MDQIEVPFRVVSDQVMPHGRLVAVELPSADSESDLEGALHSGEQSLHAAERDLAQQFSVRRRVSFVGGRVALRTAISRVVPGAQNGPILRTARGAPLLPSGVLGSVSHKRAIAVGIAANISEHVQTLGVDVEDTPLEHELTRPDLAPKILTSLERRELMSLQARDAMAYRETVRLYFALKEAVYKAIDPHVQRYVRFQEVEVFPEASGETKVRLLLPEFDGVSATVRAWWSRHDAHLIATAVCSPLMQR